MARKVAVIGLGWVAQARHIPSIMRCGGLELAGVIDRHADKAKMVAERFGIPYHAAGMSLADAPWRDEIEAMTIAAPPFAHAELAREALGMGKHVLTEKPFAMSGDEGRAMLKASADSGKILAVVHNFQFSRAFARLERDIAAGRLGAVKWIAAQQLGNPRRRLPVWYQQLPLGLFYDESPHFFYLLRRLAGGMRLRDAVAWRKGKDNTPDEIRLVYQGERDIPVTIGCNFVSPLSEWTLTVGGEKALGIVDIFRDFYIRLPQDGAHELPQIVGTSLRACAWHMAQYVPNGIAYLRGRLDYGNDEVFRRFSDAMTSGAKPQGIDAADAMAVLDLQQQAAGQVRWL